MPSRGRWTRQLPIVSTRVEVDSPITLGVIADTHASPTRGQSTLEKVSSLFARFDVGLILHAGDVGHESVLRDLGRIAPVVAVRGNADPGDLIELLPDQIVIQAGRRTILMLHGHRGKTARVAAKAAALPGIDLIVFGHSHRPSIEREGETLLFNPGSPTERRWNPHFGIGLIAVSDDAVDPELVLFDDPNHLENVKP